MSQLLIANYIREIESLIQHGGSTDENNLRKAFSNLLDAYCKPRDLRLVDELEYVTRAGAKVYPDGTIKDALRLTHGYWEAKDEFDDLDEEIEKKRAKGYPTDNILFEDSRIAVLIQNDQEAMRVDIRDAAALNRLIVAFVTFERPEVRNFRRAIEKFKEDMPKVLDALRNMFDEQQQSNKQFAKALTVFLKLCRDSINADITPDDVREMLIQHILTEDIFLRIFDDSQFHRENNVARELTQVEETFFTGKTRKNTLRGLESYYGAIRQAAAGIADHHEKQKFLKAIYENFYKVYNPKLADRLGVVYTPGEIVRFMIDGAETLLDRHFGRLLQDNHVEILDPAVGTGTFICDIIEHLKGNKDALRYKYLNEIHCNEVAILPYYIANLNIEFTYAQVMRDYAEFPHICFVDTLDNLGFEKTYSGQQRGFDFGMTAENIDRITRQNQRKISVIIGNPPYNANQMNENDNNKNRIYEGIDKRIKETYIAASSAQKTKLYDMYARFFRWAADRINADGVIAFITNRSFIDRRTFDGFRKEMAKEFNEVWVMDLGGDVRANPRLSGTTHNVFGIQTGVAISFWVKKHKQKGCKVFYARRPELEIAKDKLTFLAATPFDQVEFQHVAPDAKGNWINQVDNDFDTLLPLVSKATKFATTPNKERALFKLYSLGVSTNRDGWLYAHDRNSLEAKVCYLITSYEHQRKNDEFNTAIKWSEALKKRFGRGWHEPFSTERIRKGLYRPYCLKWLYDSELFIDRPGAKLGVFPTGSDNLAIYFSDKGARTDYVALATDCPGDLHLGASVDAYQSVPLYHYDEAGNRFDNLTDWGVKQFVKRYGKHTRITRTNIFHYVYAVLHNPGYRDKYALNLKRELPRIPLYENFAQWVAWGKALMELHVGFEKISPFPLERRDAAIAPGHSLSRAREENTPKPKLKADKENDRILIDELTMLSGIPPEAWSYRLGNRSALEWVLDQYKEATPRDPTIRKQFNTYHFADHKERTIDLLRRVCTLSVETNKITTAMCQKK